MRKRLYNYVIFCGYGQSNLHSICVPIIILFISSIQMLVEQRVELRLRQIFDELKKGQKPLLLLRDQYLRNQ